MFVLVIMLLSTLNSEPRGSNNYNIATYILEHISELENESITSIAEACFVSNSSVSRFCRQIGLKDFNELKMQLAKYNNVRDSKFSYGGRDEDDLVQSYFNRVIFNLRRVQETISENVIDQLVVDIHQHKNVYAFGYLQSAYSALNLQGDIISSGKIIETSLRFSEQINIINRATEDDLIIIFSQSGNYFDRAFREPVAIKKNFNTKIYMITMNKAMTKSPLVDEVILYDSEDDYASHPYPQDVIGCLISMKYAKYCNALE